MGKKQCRYSLPVLIVSLIVTISASLFTRHHQNNEAIEKFRSEVSQSLSSIEGKLNNYIEVMRGARAIFDTRDKITRSEWNRYYNSIEISIRYPGIRALQFCRYINPSEKEAFVQTVINDRSLQAQGYPNFNIKPDGERDYYVVVDYNEPFENNKHLHGVDVANGLEMKSSLETARDTGDITFTGKLDLYYGLSGIAIHLPVYKKGSLVTSTVQRRDSLDGFVSGVINMSDLMDGLLANNLKEKLFFQIYDRGPVTRKNSILNKEQIKTLIYSSGGISNDKTDRKTDPFSFVENLTIGGRIWQVFFYPKNELIPNFFTSSAFLVLLGGFIISALLYMLIESLEKKGMAEQLSQTSEKRFQDAVEISNEWIWEVDAMGRYTYASPVIEKLLGYKPDEILGTKYYQYYQTESDGKFIKNVKENFNTKIPFRNFVSRNLHKKGHVIYLDFSGVPITDKNGTFIGYRGSARDVTKTKKAVQELRKAKEEAEEANRLKSDFLSNISHELNTPLNSIIGFSNLLMKTELTDKQKKFSNMIKEASARLFSLINEVLELTNSELGNSSLIETEFNLKDLVDSNIAGVKNDLLINKLQLILHMDSNTPNLLKGDAAKLNRIIKLILSNAIKFTEKGEIIFSVDIKQRDGNFAQFHFAIKDSGIGIPENKKNAIFEAFRQVDGSITRKYGGIGVGLATTKHLIEKMGGEIWFESEEGVGSTFHFVCPLLIVKT